MYIGGFLREPAYDLITRAPDEHMNMTARPIMVISGTNRPESSALKLARIVAGHYSALDLAADLLSLCDLPREVFEPTAYDQKPKAFQSMQQRVLDAAGLHIIIPEYNGSFPGVLKYFIDMLKFPESFDAKPVAFVGLASGQWGGLRAVEQLQMVFGYRNAHCFPQRVFIPAIRENLDPQGRLTDAALDQRLAQQAQGFAAYCRCLRATGA
jgi:NAD(P)H-dependent FMN reductase